MTTETASDDDSSYNNFLSFLWSPPTGSVAVRAASSPTSSIAAAAVETLPGNDRPPVPFSQLIHELEGEPKSKAAAAVETLPDDDRPPVPFYQLTH